MSDESTAKATATLIASETAKRAQLRQMQSYVATVSGFFEKVLTDLLLEQPENPHAFLIEQLQAMSVNETEDIVKSVKAQDERKNNQEDVNFNRAKNAVIVSLTLTLNDEPSTKDTVIGILKELQVYAKSLPACVRYDIAVSTESNEVLISQAWASQAGLDAFYESAEFQRATPKFGGLLTCVPDERVYIPA